MKTIDTLFSDTIEIKGSKFLAFLMPIGLFDEETERLRSLHPKAVHFVSAYRLLNEFDQIVEHSSDDGEPRGTSGKPTLSVLQGHDLINVAVITVRYFGGTKLGPGGLVRAYAEAANAAVDAAVLLAYEKRFLQTIGCEYPHVSMVEYECAQQGVRIVSKHFGERGATFDVEGTAESLKRFSDALGRIIGRIG